MKEARATPNCQHSTLSEPFFFAFANICLGPETVRPRVNFRV